MAKFKDRESNGVRQPSGDQSAMAPVRVWWRLFKAQQRRNPASSQLVQISEGPAASGPRPTVGREKNQRKEQVTHDNFRRLKKAENFPYLSIIAGELAHAPTNDKFVV